MNLTEPSPKTKFTPPACSLLKSSKWADGWLGVWSAMPSMRANASSPPGTTPVQVEAPKDPIVINLNVKIEQEVRVKVDKDVEDLLADNPDLF